MGTQITIKRKALEAAGWGISAHVEPEVWDEDNQFLVYPQQSYMVIEKGDHRFVSYVSDCFYADCNAWGNNKPLFEAAGLLDIPHVLG